MSKEETVFVHLKYIRADIATLHTAISELRKEIQRENQEQWGQLDTIREKVDKQGGINIVLSILITGIALAIISFSLGL